VVEIDGASNNGVDAIRELRETVGFLPSSGKFKLYIIDEVHMLSTSAFNALLKTLEEPPGHVYFVMATTEAHKIPNTVLSRCQRLDFRRIPTRVIAAHLQTICERDGIAFEPEALWIIARQGDGSMRDAQSLLDQVINFTDGHLKRDLVVGTLGLTDRGLLNDLMAALVTQAMPAALESLQRFQQGGGDPKLLLLDLMEQIRNTLLLKLSAAAVGTNATGATDGLIDLPDSEKEALTRLGQSLTEEDLHLLFDMALKGAQDLARASDPALVLEMVLLRMTSAPRISSFSRSSASAPSAKTTAAIASSPRSAPPQPAPAPTGGKEAAPSPTPQTSPDSPLEARFRELVERIKEVNGLIGAQLENGYAVQLDAAKALTVGVSSKHKFLFDKMNQPDFIKKVINYVNSFWGPGHSLRIVLGGAGQSEDAAAVTSPKAMAEKMAQDRRQALRQAVEAHPLMQSAQSAFKTEIKSIKEEISEEKIIKEKIKETKE
jgi:DNA polymerase-3 subunit gamma/tau